MRIQICENCFKKFTITNEYSRNQIYCCDKCRQQANKYVGGTHIKMNLKKPQITIDDVARFQKEYKERTGKWLSYTEACNKLKERVENHG